MCVACFVRCARASRLGARGLVHEDREEDAVARVTKSASFVTAARVQEPRFSTF